ncbi:MAG: N-6 DNA methylase [Actinomycetota bacterium]
MAAPKEILDLVARFEENREALRAGAYSEAELRTEFIDPFFEALGWDIANKAGMAEQYKDVVREASVAVEGQAKKPDYEFRIGGTRKFYVEAKKPIVNLKDDAGVAFQIRRYAWSAKLPLGIITDFEEFAVYDCRTKPIATDKAGVGRLNYYSYKEYADKWDEIAGIFAKDAILKGAFDKYAASDKKRGTQSVDDAFLTEIESWREQLAKNIALRNGQLTVEQLNYAVQQTIDRIIFLRICEDRGIESYGDLQKIAAGTDVYRTLLKHFLAADERYNSGLFHFKKEKDNAEEPDDLTPGLNIDDKPLKAIVKRLYYPDCPYEFSVISADILGQVYERFLGKVIRLTEGHQAKVEDKPEVKKAGGVYYTPTYIVDYIVKNTVGKLVEGKTPGDVDKLKVLDPACGSGSFLIGAYQFLLDWYLEDYSNHEPAKLLKRKDPKLYESSNGYRLTLPERRRILLNNIHGVDIDSQAVEVTKLSLLLKVLEGETQRTLFDKRVLPDLSGNVKCGNSLIGTDYFADRLIPDPEEMDSINPMDWEIEFPEIMDRGGFDVVIGNPPYVRTQTFVNSNSFVSTYYGQQYVASGEGNYDIYVLFVEKGQKLLNKRGLLGLILPHKFFTTQYGRPLRREISRLGALSSIVYFGDQQIFQAASTYTCLLFLNNAKQDSFLFTPVTNVSAWISNPAVDATPINASEMSEEPWRFLLTGSSIFQKLASMPIKLTNVVEKIYQGLATSADSVFVLQVENEQDGMSLCASAELGGETVLLESELLRPLLKGSEISRYASPEYKYIVIFPYIVTGSSVSPIAEEALKDNYPRTFDYLSKCKTRLLGRSKTDLGNWWLYPYPKNLTLYCQPKILVQVLSKQGNFAFDKIGRFYFLGGGTAGGNAIRLKADTSYSQRVILGILNSSILTYYVKHVGSGFRGGYHAFGKASLSDFPLPRMDKESTAKMEAFVGNMVSLHSKDDASQSQHNKVLCERQIIAIDRQIDQLVYKLYGLTAEEIKIIERAFDEV